MTTQSDHLELLQLVYVSAATTSFDDAKLADLLTIARKNNAESDVTGVLLFKDQTFFQVLEGQAETVQSLYGKIAADSRHSNVLLLAKRVVTERNFGDWSMGFIGDSQEVTQLPGFVDFFRSAPSERGFLALQGDTKHIGQILEGFRRGRWRRKTPHPVA